MDSASLKMVLLAVLQGVTEFLPISSDGHLAVLQALLDIQEDNLLITVALHVGSLLAIVAFYARDLLGLLRRDGWRTIGLLAVGTLPLVVLGVPLSRFVDRYGTNLWVTAAGFLVTATMLLWLYRQGATKPTLATVTWTDALWIGGSQCLAVAPGISRSGGTISLGGRLGLAPETGARFSFLLAVPAIGGALILTGGKLLRGPPPTVSYGLLGLGLAVSFVVSLGALTLLLRVLRRGRFAAFGYYCLLAAVFTLGLAAYRQFVAPPSPAPAGSRPAIVSPNAEGHP